MNFLYDIGYVFFFKLKNIMSARKEKNKNKGKFDSLLEKYCYYFEVWVNTRYIPYLKKCLFSHKLNGINNTKNPEYIASLTTFPVRINEVWIAIATILNQKKKVDKVILWLAEEQFPDKKLPDTLTELQKCGLEIKYCDDLKSHKKYFYVMQEYPDSNILTFDDDIFYPRDTVKKLYKLHKKYPEDIVCITAQRMSELKDASSKWGKPEDNFEHRDDLQAFTGAGALFPPKSVSDLAFDKKSIFECAPYADDLWLKAMSYLEKTKVTQLHPYRRFPLMYRQTEESLYYLNCSSGKNLNDVQWKKIYNRYLSDKEKI